MKINESLKSTSIEHQDLTFDKLHKKIKEKKMLWHSPGTQIRLKEGNLYLKLFSFNPKGDEAVRNEKFVGAADLIRNSIDRQFGFQTIGARTVGQYVVDRLALEHGEYRVDYGDLDKVHSIIQGAREEYGLSLEVQSGAQGNRQSGVSASRISQSVRSIAEGTKCLHRAILEDVIVSYKSDGSTAPQHERTAQYIMHELGAVEQAGGTFTLDGGLSKKNIERAVKTMEAMRRDGSIPGNDLGTGNVKALLEITDMQRRIDVAGDRLNSLNHRFDRLSARLPSLGPASERMKQVTNENRKLVRELRTLTYPDGLLSNNTRAELSNRILAHCEKSQEILRESFGAAYELDGLDGNEKEMLKHCRQIGAEQAIETLSLISSLRRFSAQSLTDSVTKAIDRTMVDGAIDAGTGNSFTADMRERLSQKVEVPKTLYGRARLNGKGMSADYNRVIGKLLPFVDGFEDLDEKQRIRLDRDLKNAMTLNDTMIESFSHGQRVRRKLNDNETLADLSKLQKMRYALQCLQVRNRMMIELPRSEPIVERSATLRHLNNLSDLDLS